MRTLDQIQNEIYAKIAEDSILSTQLTSTSKVAIWRLWIYIVSFAIWTHEAIVETNAKKSRIHTLLWYREQALNFLDGVDVIWENGRFEYPTIEDMEERKIIQRCAVLESKDGELVIKITGEDNKPITSDKQLRFVTYMNEIKDAGNRLKIINRPADKLRMEINVYVDALVIDMKTGQYLEVSENLKPVEIAIETYLKNLEFNGALVKNLLRDAIQQAQGVEDLEIITLEHQYADLPYENVGRFVIPDSGHFKIENLTLNYLPNHYVDHN